MKKRTKKLAIVRETLSRLEGKDVKAAQGGSGCATSESCFDASGCDCRTEVDSICGTTGATGTSYSACAC
ncbi:MAG TPA: hypothetical protein VG477_15045 [Thermoanaerobaculia bacterium]|nr:hypothetical protein [Thermoanaerobaculia bacterium]